jgi:N4-gp56 family major capsid protein
MADTSIATSHGLSVEAWEDSIYQEYLDRLIFAGYMGTDPNSVILVKEQLAKGPGDTINVGLRAAVDGAGVTGTATLEGSEEAMSFFNQQVVIDLFRNGVRLDGVMSSQRVSFDLRNEAKSALADWLAQKVESLIAAEFSSIDGVNYASATEGQKDTWLTNNADRVLFGAAVSNGVSNDHSVALATIDGTNDVLNSSQVSLGRRLARLANPKIRPMKLDGGVECYVLFCHPLCFRDLVKDTAVQSAQREVYARMGDMHMITGGQAALWWDGVLCIESEKILKLSGVGAGSIDVGANVLCGAQAIVVAQGGFENGSRVNYVEEEFDYAAKTGFALGSIMGFEKARFDTGAGATSKQHGIVTIYSAAVAD